jgi:hypothetical protein
LRREPCAEAYVSRRNAVACRSTPTLDRMEDTAQWRAGGAVIALLIGCGVPAFLLGPAVFEGVGWAALSGAQVAAAAVGAIFGTWLLVVSCLAEPDDVRAVVEPFQGSEAVILFLPYMLWVGTKSVIRRTRRAMW